jgi:hypothetical protein
MKEIYLLWTSFVECDYQMGTGLANGISPRQMKHLKSNNQKIATTFLLQHE